MTSRPLRCAAASSAHPGMFKTRHSLPGSAPATLIPRPAGEASAPVFRLTEYDGKTISERELASVADFPLDHDDGKVRWIQMDGLGDVEALRALGEKYQLHPL